jgi:hypothetical protein
MNKFWIAFLTGMAITATSAAFIFFLLHINVHPYDKCAKVYSGPDDVSECVWILQNNK